MPKKIPGKLIRPTQARPKPTSELEGRALGQRERILPRVLKVAELKSEGYSMREIAKKLKIDPRTVSRDLDVFIADFAETDMAKLLDSMDYTVIDKLLRHWLPMAVGGREDENMEASQFVAKLIEVRRNSFGMRRSKPGPVPNVNIYQQINATDLKGKTDSELQEMLEARVVDD